ncbi:hypothetical protein ACFW0F_06880 [Brucella anthropi]|uniref:hypothetical protein n=1 Tax=Brucella anthropi TaxID=529 RepID=UPI00366D8652
MSAVRKLVNINKGVFDPRDIAGAGPFTGKRRSVERTRALYLRWPNNRGEQEKIFDAWHDVSSQIINDDGGSRFRLLSAAEKLMYWKEGVIPSTNEDWAFRCGGCAVKTITRDIDLYKSLGIFIVKYGWRSRRNGGNPIRTRLIYPSLPEVLKSSITLPNDGRHMDTRGPDDWRGDLDTRGPEDWDTRGPGTYETYEKGEGE